MNKLLAATLAGMLATAAIAQTSVQDDAARTRAGVKGSQSPDKAKKFAAEEKYLQDLSKSDQGTSQQKANVAASKAQSAKRTRLPNVKDLTPEERAQLRKELEAMSKP